MLAAECFLYRAIGLTLYARWELLADGLYHLSAFVLTWWVLEIPERWWRDASPVIA